MSLNKHGWKKKIYPENFTNYNETSPNNPSHAVDDNTNFVLRPISYENIDEIVFTTFNKKFEIQGRPINLIMLDADVASLTFQNFDQFDEQKGFLSLPYFTMWRNGVAPLYRNSPSYKPAIYRIPKMKPQGLVWEEYIMPVPKMEKLSYIFKFVTTFRDSVNIFEDAMNEYFKNKRNILILDNERFEIYPKNQDERGSLEVTSREGVEKQTLYILTYECEVLAYTRKAEDIQKRERPNNIVYRIFEGSTDKELQVGSQTATRLPKDEA